MTSESNKTTSQEIWDGLFDMIDKHLELEDVGKSPHYKHTTSAKKLSKIPLHDLDIEKLLSELLVYLKKYYDKASNSESQQNWRLEKQLEISAKNTSQEKQLEKALTRNIKDLFNQVPTASGLFDSGGGKRAIDLVLQRKAGIYYFIELKVNSDNPLMAAVEVLVYGVLYLFYRKHISSTEKSRQLYDASCIYLKVLAPPSFYSEYNLEWLEEEISEGFKTFLKQDAFFKNQALGVRFSYNAFPSDFHLPANAEEIPAYLETYLLERFFSFDEPVLWSTKKP